MTGPAKSSSRSRRLAVALLAAAGALVVASVALAAVSEFPSQLVPSVGFAVVTGFVFPGLAFSLLVDAAILAVRDRPVGPNELTILRIVAVVAAIAVGCALLEGLWKIPGLAFFFMGFYVTTTAVVILVLFALLLTIELAVQTFRPRRRAAPSAIER